MHGERKRHAQFAIDLPECARRLDILIAVEAHGDCRIVSPGNLLQHRMTRQLPSPIRRDEPLDQTPLVRIDRPDRPIEPQEAARRMVEQRRVAALALSIDCQEGEFRLRGYAQRCAEGPDRTISTDGTEPEVVPFVGEIEAFQGTHRCNTAKFCGQWGIVNGARTFVASRGRARAGCGSTLPVPVASTRCAIPDFRPTPRADCRIRLACAAQRGTTTGPEAPRHPAD